jgi:hypothetical protein
MFTKVLEGEGFGWNAILLHSRAAGPGERGGGAALQAVQVRVQDIMCWLGFLLVMCWLGSEPALQAVHVGLQGLRGLCAC